MNAFSLTCDGLHQGGWRAGHIVCCVDVDISGDVRQGRYLYQQYFLAAAPSYTRPRHRGNFLRHLIKF